MKNFTMLYEVNLIQIQDENMGLPIKLEGIPLEIQSNFKLFR